MRHSPLGRGAAGAAPRAGDVTTVRAVCIRTRPESWCRVRRLLRISCLLLAWLCANGAVWDGAQVFAWGRMFAHYVNDMPVETALTRTFDPGEPCALCLAVQKARAAEREQSPAPPPAAAVKLALISQETEPVAPPAVPGNELESLPIRGMVRRDPVPVPPPRGVVTVLPG